MYFDFANTLIYVVIASGVVFGALLIGRLIRPNHPTAEKLSTYECGEDTIGSSWVQFNVRFYIIALVFLIFDVEIALLFPWTTVFKSGGLLAFVEMLVFLGILVAGFAYVWVKGDLQWLTSLGEVKPREERNGSSPPAGP